MGWVAWVSEVIYFVPTRWLLSGGEFEIRLGLVAAKYCFFDSLALLCPWTDLSGIRMRRLQIFRRSFLCALFLKTTTFIIRVHKLSVLLLRENVECVLLLRENVESKVVQLAQVLALKSDLGLKENLFLGTEACLERLVRLGC